MRTAEEFSFHTAVQWPVLPIRVGGQWYAAALEDLERLCSMRKLAEAELPAAALPGQTGGRLAVILRGRRGLFALPVDEAETVCSAPPEMQMPLPEILRGPENAWIECGFYWAERETLCFLLRCERLEPREDTE